MENHNFSWENPLFLWPCSIAMLNYQSVGTWWGMRFLTPSDVFCLWRTPNPQLSWGVPSWGGSWRVLSRFFLVNEFLKWPHLIYGLPIFKSNASDETLPFCPKYVFQSPTSISPCKLFSQKGKGSDVFLPGDPQCTDLHRASWFVHPMPSETAQRRPRFNMFQWSWGKAK